jgi:hypothetical protein
MSLDSDILADLRELLCEHGVTARWKGIDLLVLASRLRNEQQIDIGGFVDSPDMSLRVPKAAFPGPIPKLGERISIEGEDYRISRVSNHPRSPLLTLTLTAPDE